MTEPLMPRATKRDPAKEERLQILEMLEGGAITADEAAALLDALARADRQTATSSSADAASSPAAGRPRQVRIRITDGDTGRASVNLAVPLGLVDAGLTIARRFAPDRLPDAEAVRESITTGFRGSLLDIDDGGERVEIIVE